MIKKSDIKQFLLDTKLRDVMVSPVITVRQTDDFALVQEKIALYDIRHLPVLDETGSVVGLISQRDLYQIHSPRKLEEGGWYYDKEALNQFMLAKLMVPKPFTLKPDNSLFDAIDATIRFKFGCIPIVDDYLKPCGIVTRDRMLSFLTS